MRSILTVACFAFLGAEMALSTPAQSEATCLDAIFSDLVLYAGSTDFVFDLDPGGVRLILRSSHEGSLPIGSEALIDAADDGPAGPHPGRVGKVHLLCFESGTVRIELAEQ